MTVAPIELGQPSSSQDAGSPAPASAGQLVVPQPSFQEKVKSAAVEVEKAYGVLQAL